MWATTLPPALSTIANKRELMFRELAEQQPDLTRGLDLTDPGIMQLMTLSDYVADSLLHFPALIHQFCNRDFIEQPLNQPDIQQQLTNTLSACQDEPQLMTALRHFRRLHQMRLISRDLHKLGDLQTSLREITWLADLCIQLTLDWQHQRLAKRYGEPISKIDKQPLSLIVIAMGKQGAGELNLSSDIDLIFAFTHNGDTQAGEGQKSISNQEFFTKLGQALILSLDKVTSDGFVYRVDMRLRPYGQSGPLVMNFAALEHYYHDQGREWERYAMIKARAVTGAPAHKQELMQILRSFSYRKYVDFSAFESLREMKGRIKMETIRRNLHANVKLGSGGIREVEFIVQAFQLIRGGQEIELQEPNIFHALNFLKENEYLPLNAVNELTTSYVFLRDTEHAIQALKDEQSQTLPDDELNQARIACYLGFENWQDFSAALSSHREIVAQHFANIVSDDNEQHTDPAQAIWLHIWLDECDDSEHPANQPDIQALLHRLRDQTAKMQAIGKQRLDKTLPLLLQAIFDMPEPLQTLQRIVPIIESILRRTAYLVLLSENPQALKQLVKLCDASPWIAKSISDAPILLDELLHPAHLFNPSDKATRFDDLNQRLLRIEATDLEEQMDAMRHFALAHKLQIAASDITGVLPLMKVSDHLSWLAEILLEKAMWQAWEQMLEKYGYPQNQQGEAVLEPEFLILGYGKLGGIELSYGSDLDLVFLHSGYAHGETNGKRAIDNGVFYTRMGQRLIHILNTTTRAGQLYEVDMRLRPSGASGMIVASLTGFEKYQQEQAWTWEHQALIRARVICGNNQLAQDFTQIRHEILTKPRNQLQLQQEVREMRQKMRDNLGAQSAGQTQFQLKQDAGGIVDIEFLVQYLVLAHSQSHSRLTTWTDNVRLLETLQQEGLLSNEQAQTLTSAYIAYRSLAHRRALQNQKLLLPLNELDQAGLTPHIDTVKALWACFMAH